MKKLLFVFILFSANAYATLDESAYTTFYNLSKPVEIDELKQLCRDTVKQSEECQADAIRNNCHLVYPEYPTLSSSKGEKFVKEQIKRCHSNSDIESTCLTYKETSIVYKAEIAKYRKPENNIFQKAIFYCQDKLSGNLSTQSTKEETTTSCNSTNYQDFINKEGDHYCRFTNISLRGVDLSNTYLNQSDLEGIDLTGSNLSETDLMGSNLVNSNLTESNLQGAFLSRAYLRMSVLKQANLSNAILIKANLVGVDLQGANLTEANLEGANLSRADLQGANLTASNLKKANLQGANLSKVNLEKADLEGANFTNAVVDKELGEYLKSKGISGFVVNKDNQFIL